MDNNERRERILQAIADFHAGRVRRGQGRGPERQAGLFSQPTDGTQPARGERVRNPDAGKTM